MLSFHYQGPAVIFFYNVCVFRPSLSHIQALRSIETQSYIQLNCDLRLQSTFMVVFLQSTLQHKISNSSLLESLMLVCALALVLIPLKKQPYHIHVATLRFEEGGLGGAIPLIIVNSFFCILTFQKINLKQTVPSPPPHHQYLKRISVLNKYCPFLME